MKFLVTGAAGFIGSNIVRELVRQNRELIAIDNFLTGRRENIEDFKDKVRFIEADVRDTERLKTLFRGVTYVLHQAALPSVPRSLADPQSAFDHNVNGTLSVLLAARAAGVKRVVYASSSSIYGDDDAPRKSENLPANPLSPYALTKYTGEQLCRLFSQLYRLETVSLRYFNVFGPYQDPTSQYAAVIPAFITAMLAGRSPTIYGDGEQSRDFTFVSNNVTANLTACRADNVSGQVFNIATGGTVTLNQLVALLNRLLGTALPPRYDPPRPGDVRHSQADISLAQRKLGYSVTVDFAEGLNKTIAWYRGIKD